MKLMMSMMCTILCLRWRYCIKGVEGIEVEECVVGLVVDFACIVNEWERALSRI